MDEVQAKRLRTADSNTPSPKNLDLTKRLEQRRDSSSSLLASTKPTTSEQRHLNGTSVTTSVDKKPITNGVPTLQPLPQTSSRQPEPAKLFIPKPAERTPILKTISSVSQPTLVQPPKLKPMKRPPVDEVPLFSDAKKPKKLHELQKERPSMKSSESPKHPPLGSKHDVDKMKSKTLLSFDKAKSKSVEKLHHENRKHTDLKKEGSPDVKKEHSDSKKHKSSEVGKERTPDIKKERSPDVKKSQHSEAKKDRSPDLKKHKEESKSNKPSEKSPEKEAKPVRNEVPKIKEERLESLEKEAKPVNNEVVKIKEEKQHPSPADSPAKHYKEKSLKVEPKEAKLEAKNESTVKSDKNEHRSEEHKSKHSVNGEIKHKKEENGERVEKMEKKHKKIQEDDEADKSDKKHKHEEAHEKHSKHHHRIEEIYEDSLTKKNQKFRLPKISKQYRKYIQVEIHPNGGASILKCDWRRIRQQFNKEERFKFVTEFIALGLAEVNDSPVFVICVMENGAEYLRDILSKFWI